MAILLNMNYLEFNNKKESLPEGYYRVEEHDGDISIAKVTHPSWERTVKVEWIDENEYGYRMEMERVIRDTFDDDAREYTQDTFNTAMADATTHPIANQDVMCRTEECDPAESLADLLREALNREMTQE